MKTREHHWSIRAIRKLQAPRNAVLAMVLILPLSGCSSFLPELVPFGAVTAPDQYRSLNGMGVHRRMWESTGARVLSPQKLSPRLESFDTIVLVGQTFDPPGQEARQWLEDWLGRKRGRSLIYFGRDFNANIYYREKTLGMLDPAKQSRGEELLALTRAEELSRKLGELSESTFCGWFYLDLEQSPRQHSAFSGDWQSELHGLDGAWPTGVLLQPPRLAFQNQKPSWLTNKTKTQLKPASEFLPAENSNVRRSQWTPNELDTDEAWGAAFEDLPQSQTLLAGQDGEALVFQLTHAKKYPGSKIMIVANGAPLLNGSLVEPLQRKIGEKLIEACLPSERVALLAYDSSGLLISTTAEADGRGKGLEMLTVWPLSGITVPALLMGLIVCAMLLPILGRPQKLARRSTSDFGLHVEALGNMLNKSRDFEYAKKTIGEYFQKVRGEPPPYWLEQPEPTPAPTATADPLPKAVSTPNSNSIQNSDSPPASS